VRSTRLALAYRYRFLPYLYTLFYKVSKEFVHYCVTLLLTIEGLSFIRLNHFSNQLQHQTEGHSVLRALWDEFPADAYARDEDAQFLWGSGLMVSPVVRPRR